jgi:pectate lyase
MAKMFLNSPAATELAAFGCIFAFAAVAQAQLPAFPGAEGYGATAKGGRGGEVYHVTHLGDSGDGSLRDAVGKGPRMVVFDVGGYVELKGVLRIASDITIAGQSAPGDGIGVKNYEVSLAGSHNVIIRHVRFRAGDTAGQELRGSVILTGSRDIILDHCSIQFGRWDALQLIGSSNITIQHSIIGPSIGPQQLGCMCAGDDITFSHNLFIDNAGRNPKVHGKVQLINNVVYNWQHDAFEAAGVRGPTWCDLVGNYFIAGPTTGSGYPIAGGGAMTHVYAQGNYWDSNRDGKLNGTPLADADLGPVTIEKSAYAAPAIAVTVESADVAYNKIVAGAGCSLHRDTLDTRLIGELTSLGKKGQLVSTLADAGGFGQLAGGAAPKDTDGDGIPDAWELTHNLNPKDASDRNTLDRAGYTMLEVYLNSLADSTTVPGTRTFTLQVDPGSVQPKQGGKVKITVTATRRGYDGPITLDLQNLPTGVTARKATIAQGKTTASVELDVDKGAKGNRNDVQVRGTPADGKPVNSPSFTVQVQGTVNFTLKVDPGTLRIRPGGKAVIHVTADRKDYTGAINVQLHGLPAHTKAPSAVIAAGQNAVDIEITADAKASAEGSVVARGTAENQHHDSPQFRLVVQKK